jgi:hypothetical protein
MARHRHRWRQLHPITLSQQVTHQCGFSDHLTQAPTPTVFDQTAGQAVLAAAGASDPDQNSARLPGILRIL